MENESVISRIAEEQHLDVNQVQAITSLIKEDATIPFIARYRKEATGGLDEVAVAAVRDRLNQLNELNDRKETILRSLEKQGHLTDELREKVIAAESMALLEDIYLPYKPKRRTKGVIAKEKGLEPLALMIIEQSGMNPFVEAECFIDSEKGVDSVEDALAGARDIIAEIINENDKVRALLRDLFLRKAVIKSRVASGMEHEGAKFRDYFDLDEPVYSVPSHRMLAMRRGEREGFLNLDILPDEEEATALLEQLFIKGEEEDSDQVRLAAKDCYKRLLSHSMETETRIHAKKRAYDEAIKVFSENLRQLLLAPPLGAKRIMGIDPGFRTGCKVVCLDRQGKLIHHDTVFPHMSEKRSLLEKEKIKSMCEAFEIEAIAVGNGTAGRETEAFVRSLPFSKPVQVIMVNESGASVYSASEAAREEFPDHDLTVRGAVSIGRRLMDPLAELVKIDPKSIGVGQYQHDVDQRALKRALDDVVVSCVNAVGVDLNRASIQLLSYVSGLNAGLAKNIVAHREQNGAFASRNEIEDVPRLGPKAFEQCAGFLRIPGGENPLDASAVHPESYYIVDAMSKDLGSTVVEMMNNADIRSQIDIPKYVTDKVGIPTLNDILAELAKPGRDPRNKFEEFSFAEGIEKIEDLRPGMKLPGIVTNITAFGAFVDIGVHQDGLVHISQMADRFVKNPADILKVQQKITVTVLDVDLERNRISLSTKSPAENPGPDEKKPPMKVPKSRGPKPESRENTKKKTNNRHMAFGNHLTEALIKSGLK
ncbi:MAG: Tex family protein [Thermodesulfobacteriota bacterium]|nr:Tex family protein [Thermodesulfobacteriota bacterium]